uniref:Uncharacterized protein n=1 Tax=Anguilla anguilla TaxID=7936 RepID=A0A0E9WFT1_ANGAN
MGPTVLPQNILLPTVFFVVFFQNFNYYQHSCMLFNCFPLLHIRSRCFVKILSGFYLFFLFSVICLDYSVTFVACPSPESPRKYFSVFNSTL